MAITLKDFNKYKNNSSLYASLNDENKKKFWDYGTSQGLVPMHLLNDSMKAEVSKYTSGSYKPEIGRKQLEGDKAYDETGAPVYKPIVDKFANKQPLGVKVVKPQIITQTQSPTTVPTTDSRFSLANRQQNLKESALDTPIPQVNRPLSSRLQEDFGTFAYNKPQNRLEAGAYGVAEGIKGAFGGNLLRTQEEKKIYDEANRFKGVTLPAVQGGGLSKRLEEDFGQSKSTEAVDVSARDIGQGVGMLGAEAVKYMALAPILASTKVGQAVIKGAEKLGLGKFGQDQVINAFTDMAIRTPSDVMDSIEADDKLDGFTKRWLTNTALDAAMNFGIGKTIGSFEELVSNPKMVKALRQADVTDDEMVEAVATGNLDTIKNKVNIKDNEYKANIGKDEKLYKKSANIEQEKPKSIESEYTLDTQQVPTGKLTKGFDDAVKAEEGAPLKERGFSENTRKDTNRPDALRESIDKDKLFYEQLSNKTTLESAQARFDRGYETALEDFDKTKGDLRADNVPLAKLIADEATKRGDMYTARRIVTDIAESLTTAGQFSQAAKILRESNDPATILMFVEKELKRLNEQGLKRYGQPGTNLLGGKKGWNKIELTDDELGMIKKFTEEGTEEGKEKLFQDLFDSVSKRIPTTGREKFDSFRRMAMLFNPKTHIRNIAGNSLMGVMKKVSDTIAVGGEKLIKPDLRTKSIVIPKELKTTAKNYFEANKKQLLEGSRWEVFGVKSAFAEKPIFKTGWLETLNDVSKKTLEAEDVVFFKKHFTDDLAGFMKARGLKEPTQEAIDYATKRAQEATFREANAIAEAINKLKGSKFGLIIEAAIPFTKTPANILSTGVKYSPIGAVQGAIQLMAKAPPAQAIETLSKGLTGTGLAIMGMYMGSQGLARGKYETGKAEGLSQASGILPNSIVTPQGSYTIDWAQPSAIPFFMGVAMAEEAKKNPNAEYPELVLKGLIAGGDTLVDQSMLKNIKELFGSGYGSTTEKIAKLPIDYLTQAFPTVGGQIARSIDPTKRERDYSTTTSSVKTDLQSRTPFLSSQLPPKRDILGQEQKYGNLGLINTLNQFLNPGYVGTKTNDPVIKELTRLYGTQGQDFLPRQSVSSFKDKTEFKLDNKEKSEFQRIMGTYTKQRLTSLFNTGDYKKMSDEDKASAIKKINDEGYKEAKRKTIEKRGK